MLSAAAQLAGALRACFRRGRHRPQAVLCLRMCPRAEEAADHSDLDVSKVCRVMLRRRTHDAQGCQQCPSAAISDMSYA